MATKNIVDYKAGIPLVSSDASFVLKKEVDLSTVSVANGDVLECIPVTKGMRILGVECEIVTRTVMEANGSIAVHIGDGADADGFDASVNLSASTGTITYTSSSDAYGGALGKRYTQDDTIDLTFSMSGAITTAGKVNLRALGIRMDEVIGKLE